MQVYKSMDIGSAKIKPEEMDGVPHYLVDVLDPAEEFHIVKFQEMAKEAMKKIYANGHIPILVGGTGFYIQAIVKDIDFTENEENTEVRAKWEQFAKDHGAESLHAELEKIDPKSAESIPAGNVKRVVRALEFYELSGKRISEHNEEQKAKGSPYNFAYFVLNDHRNLLYDRIEKRIDEIRNVSAQSERQSTEKRHHNPRESNDNVAFLGIYAPIIGFFSCCKNSRNGQRGNRYGKRGENSVGVKDGNCRRKRQKSCFNKQNSANVIKYHSVIHFVSP
jgi:tRNA dimethylallyltransferase